MLIYEVTVNVDPEVADEFLVWLQHHVDEMKALDPIDDAWLYRSVDEADGAIVFVSRYAMADRASYQRYLDQFAASMRSDGQARFGGRFTASRRLLEDVGRGGGQ